MTNDARLDAARPLTMNLRNSLLPILAALLATVACGCASRPHGDTSPELGRLTEPDGGVVRYTVRVGGRIEKALLSAEPDAYLGALLKSAPKGRLGAAVDDLMHGGAAEAAGLDIGDVILTFGDAKVESVAGLRAAVIGTPPGTRVAVRYRRLQEVRETEIEFDERREAVATHEYLADLEHHFDGRLTGIEVVTVPAELSARLLGSADRRVVATSVVVGSPGYHAGIRPGDRLVEADAAPLGSVADFVSMLEKCLPGQTVTFTVVKGEQRFDTDVRLVDLGHTTYWDLPVVFHHVANAHGTSTHVGSILYARECRDLPSSRREGARNLDVSLLLGLIKWEERREGAGLRLLWVLPMGW